MWDQDEHGGTSFRVSGWRLHIECQAAGIRLAMTHDSSPEVAGTISLVGCDLPPVTESFVRGDELHLRMPQTDGASAGLELALLIVQANQDFLVMESTLAIHTQWLDSHPLVELLLPGDDANATFIQNSTRVLSRLQEPAKMQNGEPTVSLLIDERDWHSMDESGMKLGSIRFFGEFMEKGVILKAQPWWVWSSTGPDPIRIRGLAAELANRPLPLTS